MSIQLTVPDMACSACSDTITKAIVTIYPNATVKADPKTKIVSVDTLASETAIKQAIPQGSRYASASLLVIPLPKRGVSWRQLPSNCVE